MCERGKGWGCTVSPLHSQQLLLPFTKSLIFDKNMSFYIRKTLFSVSCLGPSWGPCVTGHYRDLLLTVVAITALGAHLKVSHS